MLPTIYLLMIRIFSITSQNLYYLNKSCLSVYVKRKKHILYGPAGPILYLVGPDLLVLSPQFFYWILLGNLVGPYFFLALLVFYGLFYSSRMAILP